MLTGHVGRWGSGLCPLRGQNNVQGGGDMGALPNKLPGGVDVEDDAERARFEEVYGSKLPNENGWHLSEMFDEMEKGKLTALYVVGENPAQSEADMEHALHLLESLEIMIVQDIFLTKTAEMADVVFPASASWCESDGTVTSSERRVQLVRKAVDPPGEAMDDIAIIAELAKRMGVNWESPTAEEIWDELRGLSDWHGGMSYERLEAEQGLHWPCPMIDGPDSPFLHGRLWEDPPVGPLAPFHVVEHAPPIEALDDEYPMRLTTGRRLESFNTGVQSGGYRSPLRRDETIDIHPEDGLKLGIADGELVRVVSRRGEVEVAARYDDILRPGLAFMTFHFPDDVATNLLTINATDPKSGTAEFKACAVRIEKLPAETRREVAVAAADGGGD